MTKFKPIQKCDVRRLFHGIHVVDGLFFDKKRWLRHPIKQFRQIRNAIRVLIDIIEGYWNWYSESSEVWSEFVTGRFNKMWEDEFVPKGSVK